MFTLAASATIDTNPFTDLTETINVAISAGDLVAVVATWDNSQGFVSCVDSSGVNTYGLAIDGLDASSGMQAQIRGVTATAPATSVTFELDGDTANSSLTVLVFSGTPEASPVGNTAEANTTGTSHDTGNVIASANSVLVGVVAGSNGAYTRDADFQEIENDNTCVVAYKILTSGGTHSMTTTSAGSEFVYTALAEFREAAAVAGDFVLVAN